MKLTNGFEISASALTAQRLRMDVISSNIANADTTRGKLVNGKWLPYTRKMISMQATQTAPFSQVLQANMQNNIGTGVKVSRIFDDSEPYKQVFQPNHPDADANGFVLMPNVDIMKEMVDMLSATRTYEANVTALNATKGFVTKALEIGK